jgi:D-methionine transport system substrate-binding protein
MKKIFSVLLAALTAFTLTACGSGQEGSASEGDAVTLKVGATAVPHAEILNEVVKPALAKQNINLEVTIFQDYVMPNTLLAEKELDANYFQHIPWLESTNKDKGLDLTYIAGVHIEPLGLYSNKSKGYQDVSKLPQGAKVAITNGQGEHGRVLALLQEAGLLTMKEGVGTNGTIADIVDKKIELVELEPAMLPRAIEDEGIDAAVINANFALEAGLNPSKNAIYLESGKDNPYVNILAVRKDNRDAEAIQKLADAIVSPEVKAYIESKYGGSVLFVGQRF